jgi:PDZ domain-containing protein
VFLPERHRRLNNTLSFLLGIVSAALAVVLFALVPVPYVVYEPGTAEETRPMVTVAGGKGEEEGAFLLTTVEVTFANMFKFVTAGLDPHAQLFRKEDILRGHNRDEYTARQQLTMRASQANAIEAAYKALRIPYEVKDTAIVVASVIPNMGAEGVLQPGDELLALNGKEIRVMDDVASSIKGKDIGEQVTVKFKRNNVTHQADIQLKVLPGSKPPRPGIGIGYAVLQRVVSADPAKQADIAVNHIGGPSAGLMFALEIVNQLTEDDITKGRVIAGTGEITPEGKVLPIGGVRHKVVAADRKHAEVFFAPKENAAEAERKARDIGSSMKVVPVSTLQDALRYLESMGPSDHDEGH